MGYRLGQSAGIRGFRPEWVCARSFWQRELGSQLRHVDSRGRAMVLCPFHREETPSFMVDVTGRGCYHCFGCGVHGDIIDFLQKRYGLSFKEAAKLLGAWQDQPMTARVRRQLINQQLQRDRIISAAARLAEWERAVRLMLRTQVHKLGRVHNCAAHRLSQLHHGAAEAVTSEAEACWQAMADAYNQLRYTQAGYALLSFGRVGERTQFVLATVATRQAMLAEVLVRGFVSDDSGHIHEITTEPLMCASLDWKLDHEWRAASPRTTP